MHQHQASAVSVGPVPEYSIAPVELSANDLVRVTRLVRSVSTTCHIDLHEDAFNQPSLIVAPRKTHRLQLALITHRINSNYFLDEVREGSCNEIGNFPTIAGLLKELRVRLRVACQNQPAGSVRRQGGRAAEPCRREPQSRRPTQLRFRSPHTLDLASHRRQPGYRRLSAGLGAGHIGTERCPRHRWPSPATPANAQSCTTRPYQQYRD